MNGSEERIPNEAIFVEDPTNYGKSADEQTELQPILEDPQSGSDILTISPDSVTNK